MFSCILLFHSKIVLRNCWHTHFSEQEGNTRHTIKTELPFSQPNRSTPNQVYFILCVATTPQSCASEAIQHERQAKVSSQWSKSPAADRLLLQASLHIWFDIPHWISRLSKRLWSADNATVFSFGCRRIWFSHDRHSPPCAAQAPHTNSANLCWETLTDPTVPPAVPLPYGIQFPVCFGDFPEYFPYSDVSGIHCAKLRENGLKSL